MPGVYNSGIYVCTAWGRFETVKEIQVYASMGAHVVGHTLAHELPVFRRAGVRLASVGIVSNHAEGREEWVGDSPDGMAEFYLHLPPLPGAGDGERDGGADRKRRSAARRGGHLPVRNGPVPGGWRLVGHLGA